MSTQIVIAFCFASAIHAQPGLLRSAEEAEQLIRSGNLEQARLTLHSLVDSASGVGADDAQLAVLLNNLGSVYHDLSRGREAIWYYRKSIAVWEHIPPGPAMVAPLTNLAGLWVQEGRLIEAGKLYQRALEILDENAALHTARAATAYNGMAQLAVMKARYGDAERYARQALKISEGAVGLGEESGLALQLLAVVRKSQGATAEAELLLLKSAATLEQALGPGHQTTASSLAYLAVLISKTRPVEAERLFRGALTVYEARLGAEHPQTGELLASYAKLLRSQQGRKQEAKLLQRRSAAIADHHQREHPGRHSVDLSAFRSGKQAADPR